ncbi:DUF2637 domain-containing protein [Mycolicibacterium moriokaense]|uniref:DUF2637 domain-containing protein n=1 Tax=Mycolicibacterium moriokaense TaxID=39691 RepID=UPI001F44E452|nr:DUF2637 domain-containing protein [Mycolicibacterium moriokaense]
MWLIVATSMSVAGNVAHAVLHAAAGTVALAAGASLVPPLVLLAATHSVAVLVRTRAGGLTYWCALLMTLALASCAFVLSFDALRSLAEFLGLPEAIAWLWPCAIDVAIAQATLCLLSLSRRADIDKAKSVAAETVAPPVSANDRSPQPEPVRPERKARVAVRSGGNGASRAATARQELESLSATVGPADVERWRPVAESLVREGVTSKHPRLVAAILAHREAGMPPSAIGRRHQVHHTTVGRILSAAQTLTA